MSDVRLTATNPVDSSVVPVACNERGELLTVPPVIEQIDNDVTIDGTLSVTGFDVSADEIVPQNAPTEAAAFRFLSSGTFTQDVRVIDIGLGDQGFTANNNVSAVTVDISSNNKISAGKDIAAFRAGVSAGANLGNGQTYAFLAPRGAPSWFGGEVTVSSRNKKWTLVEQGGLCHMVEDATTRFVEQEEDSPEKEYPKLRDVFNELNLIEGVLEEIMSRLKMVPPAGWEVWDGSNETV